MKKNYTMNQKTQNLAKCTEIELSTDEYDIYSKQIILEQVGTEGQKKLRCTKVLVIGAGGLGCPTIIYLAVSGIGHIGIVDQDKIEKSNLNRQILYNKHDIGKEKVLSAKDKLNHINENCKIITHKCKLNKKNNIEIISHYDIIVDATDNFQTRHLIDQTCRKLHKIYIYGAVKEFEGQIAVFNYKNGIRYKDLHEKKLKIIQNNCNARGVMGVTTGYIGTLQAIEVVKTILGTSKKCKNFIISYNLIEIMVKKKLIHLKRSTTTNNYKTYQPILLNVDSSCNKNKIYIIIDLRNSKDFDLKHKKKSINIPILKFKLTQTISLINKFKTIGEILIHCNKKDRSIIASKFLIKYSLKHQIKQYTY
uniref:Molybdopterin-synthase adenylyltransferase n=1 Tax=Vertebrata lanosa TaxID=1261582 RepID=A0A0B5W5L4_9FLOR|nr:molybdopterin-synthase adenylyltransferase [Vertebrata lanosa]AJH65886.1 molybdopterin-synthase adenylyltransferase [Vertebrata lanosa]